MQAPWDAVMSEAFRRAQMSNRVFPQLCDFPPSVPRDVVELKYLMPLRALSGEGPSGARALSRASPAHCGPLEVTGYADPAHEAGGGGAPSLLTHGGDVWAAALYVEAHLAPPVDCTGTPGC